MKRAKPNIVDRLKAKAAAQPNVQAQDLANVLVAARLGLPQLRGVDLVNVSVSMANLEAVVAALMAKPQPQAQDAAPADSAAPAAEAKKGA